MAILHADLRLRRELIEKIDSVLKARMLREELTQREAAEMLGVSHPRIADVLAKRAERFSLDRLALLAEQLGLNVRIRAPEADCGTDNGPASVNGRSVRFSLGGKLTPRKSHSDPIYFLRTRTSRRC